MPHLLIITGWRGCLIERLRSQRRARNRLKDTHRWLHPQYDYSQLSSALLEFHSTIIEVPLLVLTARLDRLIRLTLTQVAQQNRKSSSTDQKLITLDPLMTLNPHLSRDEWPLETLSTILNSCISLRRLRNTCPRQTPTSQTSAGRKCKGLGTSRWIGVVSAWSPELSIWWRVPLTTLWRSWCKIPSLPRSKACSFRRSTAKLPLHPMLTHSLLSLTNCRWRSVVDFRTNLGYGKSMEWSTKGLTQPWLKRARSINKWPHMQSFREILSLSAKTAKNSEQENLVLQIYMQPDFSIYLIYFQHKDSIKS